MKIAIAAAAAVTTYFKTRKINRECEEEKNHFFQDIEKNLFLDQF